MCLPTRSKGVFLLVTVDLLTTSRLGAQNPVERC